MGEPEGEVWETGLQKFIKAMKNRKEREWVDIKELTPLEFMPYVARLFRDITNVDLRGLSDYTGWMGLGGYYHWKLAQLGQLNANPQLAAHPVPRGPVDWPSGRPHPRGATQSGWPAPRSSGQGRGTDVSGQGRLSSE